MPNYANSKIYSVRCYNDTSLVYIGSTTQKLTERWGGHRRDWKCGNHLPFHKKITNINDWYIQLEECFPCKNKEELHKKEYEIMRKLSTLNTRKGYFKNFQFDNLSKLDEDTIGEYYVNNRIIKFLNSIQL
jgi:hypothetical protein